MFAAGVGSAFPHMNVASDGPLRKNDDVKRVSSTTHFVLDEAISVRNAREDQPSSRESFVRNNVGDLEVATRVSHFELRLMRQCRECRFD